MSGTHRNDERSHASGSTQQPAPSRAGARSTPAPRDAAADQLRLLMLLTADWLNNDRTHAREIAALAAAMAGAQGPPVNVDVPAVTLTGATAACTMGNWSGEPTEYAYVWHRDGVAIEGASGATYAVTPEDSGHSVACVVTATNAQGATAAPMSNAVAIP